MSLAFEASLYSSAHAFSSRLSSFRKRQSVPSAMIFCGLDRIRPASCSRSASRGNDRVPGLLPDAVPGGMTRRHRHSTASPETRISRFSALSHRVQSAAH